MKKLIVALTVLTAAGCSHIRDAGFDVENHTFTLRGNQHASREDFNREAAKRCETTPVLLGCATGSNNPDLYDFWRCTYRCDSVQAAK